MRASSAPREIKSLRDFIPFFLSELKPRGKIFTLFNIISVPVIILGVVLIAYRMVKGIGSITNLSQEFAWGMWIGFDVMTGVAFAGGAYVLTFVVYILRIEKYHPIVRATAGRTHGCTDQACKREESSCQLGAVHTWHLADISIGAANIRFRG